MSTKSVSEKLLIRPNSTALVFADDSDSLRRVLDEDREELVVGAAVPSSP
jgi:hypothetical protein